MNGCRAVLPVRCWSLIRIWSTRTFGAPVLVVSEHEPNEGALGVIINRPLDRPVAELVWMRRQRGSPMCRCFWAVQLEENQLMFAAFEWQKGAGLKLNHNIAFEEGSDAQGHKNSLTVCAFVGYAGWGAGQLESEVKQKAWVVQNANRSVLKADRLPKCVVRHYANAGAVPIRCSQLLQMILRSTNFKK